MPRTNELTLLPKLPLLITESADEFDALRDAFEQEIKPRGIIEQIYVHDMRIIRFLNAFYPGRVALPKPLDSSATMPRQEPDRSAEAIRRVLPELRKLDRYERRAAARRDRAVSIFLIEIKYRANQ